MNEQTRPPRRATNISLDTALLAEAKALGVNISRACEKGLADQIRISRAQRWREENRDALASSNAHVEREGLPLSRHRAF
ncbi:type II toxin-antitoxin system CcdA family antitoxin [Sphingobium amiense]|uniref:type II toxin-antitoxin system CcdA family antitoxin n=1 Tax=Sphingobium amiense TaxID=135719 RepID=UPI00082A4AF2|nr:type II toxin-antitoxin system CcdA family antitoxin [Sphingobium amiense]